MSTATRPSDNFPINTRTRKSRSRFTLIAQVVLGLVIGGIFVLYAVSEVKSYLDFQSGSITVDATVIDLEAHHTSGRNPRTNYIVTYEYQANSTTYRDSFEVGQAFYPTLTLGQEIPIRYLANEPTASIIAGQGMEYSTGWVYTGAALLFGLVMMIVPLIQLRAKRK